MSSDAQKILDAARQLPPDQREWLAECLLIDDDHIGFSEVESSWDEEIKRRLDEIDSGTAQMTPLDDVLARMNARRRARQKE